ncbi:SEL1-like repeat protein [Permianibacter sp. IMCC34836]|uniref:TonB family protein n=1 Tax=Permianibacter fluminis TaxID=2738515 RepID=UPI001555E50A|nr:TonB family protein [Permianibacter fluminis]NQD36198.1 SEL1-like repeat protein [Permianibacter fluminis]
MFSRSALICLSLCALPALADYSTGVGAYSRKDFPAARAAFQQVAELADPQAQRALASMHARGEGGPVDLLEAYAWASLAAEQGDATASKIREAIAASLPAAMKPQAETRLQGYRVKYGIDSVKRELYPLVSGNEASVFDLQVPAARIRQQLPVVYPERAKEKNDQGYACVSFYVDSAGKPLDVRRYDSKGNGILVAAAEKLLADWRFEPEPSEQRVGHCIDFLIEDDKTWRPAEQVEQQRAKVRKGEARSTMELARDFSNSERTVTNRVETQAVTEAWLQAALTGAAEAQTELASRLMRGAGCVSDRAKAAHWLQLAIAQDYAPAKHIAALWFEGDKQLAMSAPQQSEWLQQAADAGNALAMLRVAKQQLKPGAGQNATAALALLKKLPTDWHIHVLDWLAYGYALTGDFSAAQDDADDALDLATDIGLTTERRQAALKAVENEQLPPLPAH